jgi:hypothetical protein
MLSSLDTSSEIVFGRRSAGGPGTVARGDVLFSRVRDRNREALTVRIRADVLSRLNWLAGDSVLARRRDDGLWVIERVAAGRGGVKLYQTNGARGRGHSLARFSADSRSLDAVFPGGERSWTASLVEAGGNVAVFEQD